MRLSALYLLLALVLLSCSTSGPTRKNLDPKAAPELSKEEASFRSKKVSDVHYNLSFDLRDKNTSYKGFTVINFKLSDASTDLRVDFYNGEVQKLVVNSHKVTPQYNSHYLLISKKDLLKGQNKIEITFKANYSSDGSGFYNFVDKEDGLTYTYTDLEPFDAHKVFPCFDQPDLKASYKMQVLAPTTWHVITSVLPSNIKNHSSYKEWSFPESQVFSTYIWSLHAGPYAVFEDSKAKYPSRVFVRQSLKKYVKVNDWHTFTRQSFEFLDDYFAYPYPYKKYDQVIAPDFNAGAMENVAAVTFSESFVKRGEKTQAQRRRLANVIFHEMTHMWFGDLVTMKWWNDLWLNESFATYIAHLGMSRNTEFKDKVWRDFRGTKEWALWEDQQVTTHPIEADVPNTSQAMTNFDGITYGKGASSLKQIHYYLGEDGFKKGLQIYFKKYATKNTELKDFMGALEEGSSKDLTNWQEKWLQTTGVNTANLNYTCKNQKVQKFEVTMTSEQSPRVTRPHAFEVAFLDSRYKVQNLIKVVMDDDQKVVKEAVGLPCPRLVYANYNDHDYLMVSLDKETVKRLEVDLHLVKSPFLRQLFWSALWQMTYYGTYSYLRFADLVQKQLLTYERDPIILQRVLGKGVVSYLYNDPKLNDDQRLAIMKRLEDALWARLQKATPGSESQKILFRYNLWRATSPHALKRLASFLDGRTLNGLKIDQDKRWHILERLSSFSYPGILKRIEKESAADPSHLGKKMKIAAEVSYPRYSTKKEWIDEFLKEKSNHSYAEFKSALYNLFPLHQKKLKARYKDFFKDLAHVNKTKDLHVARAFTALLPSDCTQKSIDDLSSFLNSQAELKPNIEKAVKIARQENVRCLKVISR